MDYTSFKYGTLQLIAKSVVTDKDIKLHPEYYVEGSQGQTKIAAIVIEPNVYEYEDKIRGTKKAYFYKYQDEDNPEFVTEIEIKEINFQEMTTKFFDPNLGNRVEIGGETYYLEGMILH